MYGGAQNDRSPSAGPLRRDRSALRALAFSASEQRGNDGLLSAEHADATGCRIVLPQEAEAVLLGSAILGAVACGDQPSVLGGMSAMSRAGSVVEPQGDAVREFHSRKYRVFQAMYRHQLEYRSLMAQ